jgi:hypothetical protein
LYKTLAAFSWWTGILLPLGGIIILLLYYFTENDIYPVAGFLYFYLAIPINLLALGATLYLGYRKKQMPAHPFLSALKLKLNSWILLLSYPLGVLCLIAGTYLTNTCYVVIDNKSDQTLAEIVLSDSLGKTIAVDNVKPHSSQSLKYRPQADASVTLKIGSIGKEVQVFGYVSGGSNQHSRVEFTDENSEIKVTVTEIEDD